ncbi:hypothetical protein Vadar_034756 [Vaccinium darrowii]|uniref:Uncharacterized protein n=1 Tax=Vaccinium darrowii TaxID=229202 RepID=A0ACB7YAN4_9ERIC|nr:hypothetical protein Vadar_034756 [Vaccinium darrowii]
MERRVIVPCSIVGFLGLLSTALDFAAEAMRMKGSQVQLTSPSTCTNPSSTVANLGLIAVCALGTAQVIMLIETGCFCHKRGPHLSKTNPALAVIYSAVSWFTYAIAVLLYFGIDSYYCYFGKPGVFAVAAILSLASVILRILQYLVLYSATDKTNAPGVGPAAAAPNQAGIAMGQPQFPPPNIQASLSVHQNNRNMRVECGILWTIP